VAGLGAIAKGVPLPAAVHALGLGCPGPMAVTYQVKLVAAMSLGSHWVWRRCKQHVGLHCHMVCKGLVGPATHHMCGMQGCRGRASPPWVVGPRVLEQRQMRV